MTEKSNRHSLSPNPSRRLLRAGVGLTLFSLAICLSSVAALATDGSTMAKLFASSFSHETKGQTTRALSDVEAILKGDRGHYVANLRAGWLSYQSKKYARSIEYYTVAVAVQPNALEPKLGLMLPLMAKKRWADAARIASQVLQKAPRNYLALSRLAYIDFNRGRYGQAEKRYRQLLADYPSDTEMMLGLAWTLTRQGRNSQAQALFNSVLTIHGESSSARQGLIAAR